MTRSWLPAMVIASLTFLTPAAARAPAAPACAAGASLPSRLDYLVIASFADTPGAALHLAAARAD